MSKPIIDREAWQTFLGISEGGDYEFLQEVLDSYFEEAPKLIQDIQLAVLQGDAKKLQHAAHTLKSTSTVLGAVTLTELCNELEELGKAGATGIPLDRGEAVAQEYAKAKAALEQVIQ
ncbi:MAG: Hpt domain-containing protein [Scytolyngbya sp. HA4215-MV1]|nr:Hpt domain-containing protein [Scytolyngbya sp. HA4215-MV1]